MPHQAVPTEQAAACSTPTAAQHWAVQPLHHRLGADSLVGRDKRNGLDDAQQQFSQGLCSPPERASFKRTPPIEKRREWAAAGRGAATLICSARAGAQGVSACFSLHAGGMREKT